MIFRRRQHRRLLHQELNATSSMRFRSYELKATHGLLRALLDSPDDLDGNLRQLVNRSTFAQHILSFVQDGRRYHLERDVWPRNSAQGWSLHKDGGQSHSYPLLCRCSGSLPCRSFTYLKIRTWLDAFRSFQAQSKRMAQASLRHGQFTLRRGYAWHSELLCHSYMLITLLMNHREVEVLPRLSCSGACKIWMNRVISRRKNMSSKWRLE